ncbi:MAG: hypothetical protein ACLFPD_07530 [Desulfosudaceae bacterium]
MENGWSMAALGILIDLTGLAVLSFIISLVPKFVGVIERGGAFLRREDRHEARQEPAFTPTENQLSSQDIRQIALNYKAGAAKLEEPFQLAELYRLSEDNGLPHPHLTIKALREENLLIAEGNGLFRWNV